MVQPAAEKVLPRLSLQCLLKSSGEHEEALLLTLILAPIAAPTLSSWRRLSPGTAAQTSCRLQARSMAFNNAVDV